MDVLTVWLAWLLLLSLIGWATTAILAYICADNLRRYIAIATAGDDEQLAHYAQRAALRLHELAQLRDRDERDAA